MRRAFYAAAALAALAVTAPASAAPSAIAGATAATAADASMVEKVNGWHQSCRWGPRGWHRHTWRFGRVACLPPPPPKFWRPHPPRDHKRKHWN